MYFGELAYEPIRYYVVDVIGNVHFESNSKEECECKIAELKDAGYCKEYFDELELEVIEGR